jgi:hypothetical protein
MIWYETIWYNMISVLASVSHQTCSDEEWWSDQLCAHEHSLCAAAHTKIIVFIFAFFQDHYWFFSENTMTRNYFTPHHTNRKKHWFILDQLLLELPFTFCLLFIENNCLFYWAIHNLVTHRLKLLRLLRLVALKWCQCREYLKIVLLFATDLDRIRWEVRQSCDSITDGDITFLWA